ncbi:MAG: iron ABC transporter permease, partial [Acidimicrobiia bacterium]
MNQRRRHVVTLALVAIPTAFLGYFYLYPMATILLQGLAPEGELSLSAFGDVLTSKRLMGVAWFTVWQAALSTALT